MTKTMDKTQLCKVAEAAGINLEAHGGRAVFSRALGVYPAQISNALNSGKIGKTVTRAANALLAAIESGDYTPQVKSDDQAAAILALRERAAEDVDPDAGKSDEQLMAESRARMAEMRRRVWQVASGKDPSPALLITGPGGIGKTYPVKRIVREVVAETGGRCEFVTGSMSPGGFYEKLYHYRFANDVFVIDDADGGFDDPKFMNIFKGATDSEESDRHVSWLTSRKTGEDGVPDKYKVESKVIVISNLDFGALAAKSSKTGKHMDAFLSRMQKVELGFKSRRSVSLRVYDMLVNHGMLNQRLAKHGYGEVAEIASKEIADFMLEHQDDFRAMTLREAVKLCNLYIANDGDPGWKTSARYTLE